MEKKCDNKMVKAICEVIFLQTFKNNPELNAFLKQIHLIVAQII